MSIRDRVAPPPERAYRITIGYVMIDASVTELTPQTPNSIGVSRLCRLLTGLLV